MKKTLREMVPDRVRKGLGSDSPVIPLNGRDVFSALRNDSLIVMACNARLPHVIPGIMKAAEELDAVVAFELTRTEGGLDGGYTGQTPRTFFDTVIDAAERQGFTKPFIVHGDHITVRDDSTEELAAAEELLRAQIDTGFTSFTIDASYNPLNENIKIIKGLSALIDAEGYGLEVELRNSNRTENGESPLTTVEEAQTFLSGLADCGVRPQLLSIYNLSKSGHLLDGQKVKIDLPGTMAIFAMAQGYGVAGLVENGITATPRQVVGRLADYGIRKGNIGTLWQNIAHAGLPFELMNTMRNWARENRCDIKYATAVFRNDIDAIPGECVSTIHEMAYREAKELLTAFRAKGSATLLAERLGASACA